MRDEWWWLLAGFLALIALIFFIATLIVWAMP
jgi:hypothetical protein